MSFLTLTDLTKSFGELTAVADVNLSVEQGEFVSLLGPSGCGKTTTLQMIAGFVDVTRGRITLDGQDITHMKPNRRGLGIVFQSYALFPHMSVAENVGFGLDMRGVDKAERAERIRAALALVRLDALAHRFPRELSGGQRQRVAIARAVVIEPPVLLLDEPMSNLDAKLREEMQFELRAIQRKIGTTTIMVTHDQSEALSISDRVVVMEAGRITQIDTPYHAYERPENRFVSQFIGKANLLPGTIVAHDGDAIRIDLGHDLAETGRTAHLPAHERDARVGDPVSVCIRPEKLRLCAPGAGRVAATVTSRFFLGSQWLYRVDSALGEVLVCCQNEGAEPLAEGAPVGIDWHSDAVRVMRREA
ncbi:ABC transporter ATP-binding protein [Burkholderia multivorans]|uniref:ABC transporter ATP-binding protein n=1 Tax=Burkholderia multivorans TaxID=87883 RepID=UPI0012DE7286|nr:ABC transporter ATP-binding protein [Burkholderia multivorans]MBU9339018.1 ABC transporter ATP-binding protein [Burkholderia multivorans]MCA8141484.1 ABC transporter ATP-binding protein [Burkholderia multivorans]MCO1364808.1 ABC transporter ATP-binding protein [Burkholderia multivorans]MCO1378152.1 ABC transporter ATP-binding protein [Burkholderia multivorans]QGR63702.1 ATP-binding cassette domain-containing protein [Burkholderia multivorans]